MENTSLFYIALLVLRSYFFEKLPKKLPKKWGLDSLQIHGEGLAKKRGILLLREGVDTPIHTMMTSFLSIFPKMLS